MAEPSPGDRLRAIVARAGFADARFPTPAPPDAPPLLWARQAPLGLGAEGVARASLRYGDGLVGGAAFAGLADSAARGSVRAAGAAGCAALLLCGDEPGSPFIEASAAAGLCLVDLRTGLSAPKAALALARALSGKAPMARAEPGAESRAPTEPCAARLVRVAAMRPPRGSASVLDGLEASLPGSARLKELRRAPDGVAFIVIAAEPARDRECRDSLKAYAAGSGVSIGLSDAIAGSSSAADLQRLSEHALRSLELGGSLFGEGRLSCYDNAALYLAYVDDGRREPLLAFSRRTLERIRAHDEATGDGLYRSVEAYFKNDRNARRTAAELGIHRHTLAGRLARVERVTDYPMDAEGRLGYELALAMRHWTKGRVSR